MTDLILEPLEILIHRFFVAYSGDVYLQGDYPWTANSLGLIHLTDGFGEPRLEDLYPEFLERNYLQKAISLERAQDSVTNAFNQKEHITLKELVICFNFHYINDGFYEFINRSCHICGLRQLNPPRDENGIPSWEICDCCGAQAGIDDIDINMIRINRVRWLNGGATWVNPQYKPFYWDYKMQLEDISPEFF